MLYNIPEWLGLGADLPFVPWDALNVGLGSDLLFVLWDALNVWLGSDLLLGLCDVLRLIGTTRSFSPS